MTILGNSDKKCKHYWMVVGRTPHGEQAAICKKCGSKRAFSKFEVV